MTKQEFSNTKGKDDWLTPQWLIDGIQNHINIFLDPCASIDTDIGNVNYRLEDGDNGLEKNWVGNVFVNPPFSEKKKWAKKVVNEIENTKLILFLTPDSTDVKSWWHGYVTQADYVWFSYGRICFDGPSVSDRPTFGTSISMFGEVPNDLLEFFKDNGWVVETVK